MREYVKNTFWWLVGKFFEVGTSGDINNSSNYKFPAQGTWRGRSEREGNSFDRVVFNMNGKKIKIHLTEWPDYFTAFNNLKKWQGTILSSCVI